ncbi:MAG: hypothetical protein PHP23_08260 [Desulfobacterales bacterium]|nr:hypothetical protein [Desulfobacterales bacterium]MDD4072946.1 hypothetical protein [Desulfobacterales bacterium]MDD4393089.1 hypothetical protein [Desulfobacterales bacterium]
MNITWSTWLLIRFLLFTRPATVFPAAPPPIAPGHCAALWLTAVPMDYNEPGMAIEGFMYGICGRDTQQFITGQCFS